ncbi:MAG TPA: nucleotidyltransferase family protein [Caldilineaceae bacterium]|nr:nucleotidyltransferase family protein [Caldilineaceae bacterium]
MKALILAAGKGTRISHLASGVPKPMLPVAGRPLLEHLIEWLRASGITSIAINLHHLPKVIPTYFGNGAAHGVSLTYSFEPHLLGTAGAAKALAAFLDERFVVVYGDVFTNCDLRRMIDVHQRPRAAGNALLTMAVYRVPNPTECGLVELAADGRIVRFVEKPPAEAVFTDLANAGLLVCEPDILDLVPAQRVYDFSHDLIPSLLDGGAPLYGVELQPHEFLVDIGTPAGYARAQQLAAPALA